LTAILRLPVSLLLWDQLLPDFSQNVMSLCKVLILRRSRTGSSMHDAEPPRRKPESVKPTASHISTNKFVIWHGPDRSRSLHGVPIVWLSRHHNNKYIVSSHVTSIFSESIWRIAHLLFLPSLGFSRTLYFSFLNHQLYRTKALRGWTQDGALRLSFF
jgi:hypothetical protein